MSCLYSVNGQLDQLNHCIPWSWLKPAYRRPLPYEFVALIFILTIRVYSWNLTYFPTHARTVQHQLRRPFWIYTSHVTFFPDIQWKGTKEKKTNVSYANAYDWLAQSRFPKSISNNDGHFLLSLEAVMNPGSRKIFRAKPPDKGSFPLDHDGELM